MTKDSRVKKTRVKEGLKSLTLQRKTRIKVQSLTGLEGNRYSSIHTHSLVYLGHIRMF
jgi:hypothetical protein